MNMTERNYLQSRPLDVHRWSEHPEVNIFVDTIYNNDFRQGNENQRIKKKHLKLVLLDLYLAWFDDPDLKLLFKCHSLLTVMGKYLIKVKVVIMN